MGKITPREVDFSSGFITPEEYFARQRPAQTTEQPDSWDALKSAAMGLPRNIAKTGIQTFQGQGGVDVVNPGFFDKIVQNVNKKNAEERTRFEQAGGKFVPGIPDTAIIDSGASLPYTFLALLGGFGGGAAAAPIPIPGARVGGAMAGSYVLTNRASGYEAMNNNLQRLNQLNIQETGEGITEEQQTKFKELYSADISTIANWESGTETASALIELALYNVGGKYLPPALKTKASSMIAGMLKNKVTRSVAGGSSKAVGTLITELAEEVVTEIGQGRVEADIWGDEKPEWSAGGVLEAAKKVAPSVILTTGAIHGAGTLANRLQPKALGENEANIVNKYLGNGATKIAQNNPTAGRKMLNKLWEAGQVSGTDIASQDMEALNSIFASKGIEDRAKRDETIVETEDAMADMSARLNDPEDRVVNIGSVIKEYQRLADDENMVDERAALGNMAFNYIMENKVNDSIKTDIVKELGEGDPLGVKIKETISEKETVEAEPEIEPDVAVEPEIIEVEEPVKTPEPDLSEEAVAKQLAENEAARVAKEAGEKDFAEKEKAKQKAEEKQRTIEQIETDIVKRQEESKKYTYKAGDVRKSQLAHELSVLYHEMEVAAKAEAGERVAPARDVNGEAKAEEVLDTVNPTGGVFGEYNPAKIVKMKLVENITTLDKTSNKNPDDIITIYRGAPKEQTEIVPGDFVTTNKQLAKDYAGDEIVLRKDVKMSDVLDDSADPLMEEYIYRPIKAKATHQATHKATHQATHKATHQATHKPQAEKIKDVETKEIPLEKIKYSKELPQFKEGADAKGVVEPLRGKYERVGTPPIVLWERKNGDLEIMTGRHRYQLALEQGEETIPAQILKEADGFTAEQAAILDVESNIRDENGSVRDYATYFKETGITEKQATDRGLLSRVKGKNGFTIGKYASDDLYAAYRNKDLNEKKVVTIAKAVPNNKDLQSVGAKYAMTNSAEDTKNYLQVVKTITSKATGKQVSLFGENESWQIEADKMAKVASGMVQNSKQERNLLKSAGKLDKKEHKKFLDKYGIKAGDTEAVNKRIVELDKKIRKLDNWAAYPDVVADIKKQAGIEEKKPDKSKPFKQPWETSDLSVSPNIGIASVQAQKQLNGKYKLFFGGTRNEVFQGEEFRTVQEARTFFKVQKIKAQEAVGPKKKPEAKDGKSQVEETEGGYVSDTAGGIAPTEKKTGKTKWPQVVSNRRRRYLSQTTHIKNLGDAAAFAEYNLSGFPQERLVALLLGDKGKILGAHRFSIGTTNMSTTHTGLVAGQALNTKGVREVILVHNHPSGNAKLSDEDIIAADAFYNLLLETKIAAGTIIAVSKGKYSANDKVIHDIPKLGKATNRIPMMVRTFKTKGENLSTISNSTGAKHAGKKHIPEGGLLFLNQFNTIVGTMRIDNYAKLRGKNATEILKQIEKANATTIIAYNPNRSGTKIDADNLKKFANAAQVKLLDVITSEGSQGDYGTLPTEGSSIYFETAAPEKDLITYHNATEHELLAALESGGLAVPSMAITQKDIPYDKYGEITLIGDKNLIDPQADSANRVFNKDIYSPTMPGKEWNVDKKEGWKVFKRFEKIIDETKEDKWYLDDAMSKGKNDFLDYADTSNALKIAFLRENNISTRIPKKATPVGFVFSDTKIMREYYKKHKIDFFNHGDEVHKEISKVAHAAMEEYINAKSEDVETKEHLKKAFKNTFNEDGLVSFSEEHNIRTDARNIRGKTFEVDNWKLEDTLKNKFTKKLSKQYAEWISKIAEPIYGEPYLKLGRKKVPYTLENIVKAITRQGVVAKEETMVFGTGKVAAHGAGKISSIKQMHKGKHRLVRKEIVEKAIAAQEILRTNATNDLIERYKHKNWRGDPDTWAALDDAMRAAASFLKGNGKTVEKMQSALRRYGFEDVPNSLAKKMVIFADAIADTPTQYFEAKIQRGVGFNEFAGVVIPKGSSKKLRVALKNAGLKIRTYEKYNSESRQKAISFFHKQKDVLFETSQKDKARPLTRATIKKAFSKMSNVATGIDKQGNFWFRFKGFPRFTIHEMDSINDRVGITDERQRTGAFLDKSKQLWFKTGGVGAQADIGSLYHEQFHLLRKFGVVSKADTNAIKRAIRRGGHKGTITEETEASWIGDAAKSREYARDTVIGRIIQKIGDFIDSMVNLLMTTSRGVSRKMESGKMAEQQSLLGREGKATPVMAFETIINQAISSAQTSRNIIATALKQIPTPKGGVNLDIGGGKYEKGTRYLKEKGITNLIYDPYNRSKAYNDKVIFSLSKERADTCTVANVLNVVKEKNVRSEIIRQAAKAIKKDGVVYFQIYNADKSGIGKETKVGETWQNNLMPKSYIQEIENNFGSVKILKGHSNIIEAKLPTRDKSASLWKTEAGSMAFETMAKEFGVSAEQLRKEFEETKEKYEGTDKWLKAPNGKKSNLNEHLWVMTRTPRFKEWFGGSKVLDANGDPLVVYHGTSSKFTKFNRQHDKNYPEDVSDGFYFTSNTEHASQWRNAGIGGNIIPVFLSAKNVAIKNYAGEYWDSDNYVINAEKTKKDGAIRKNMKSRATEIIFDEYVVFNPNQIKSIYNTGTYSKDNADIRYQQAAKRFYSQVIKTVETKMPKKMQASAVMNWLKKQPGVKTAELEWMNIEEMLEGKKSVGREELVELLRANQVVVEEVEKGEEVLYAEKDLKYRGVEGAKNSFKGFHIFDVPGNTLQLPVSKYKTEAEARNYALTKVKKYAQTKFRKYQLEGKKENYRELLFRLPPQYKGEQDTTGWTAHADSYAGRAKYVVKDSLGNVIGEYFAYDGQEAIDIAAGRVASEYKQENFQSSHWDETNVFAHIRVRDEVDVEDNKVLFVEESQPEWAKALMDEFDTFKKEKYPQLTKLEKGKERTILEKEAKKEFVDLKKKDEYGTVPFMPLWDNAQEVIWKRIIRMAAEQGFDKVSWITGQQTANRYDLSKQVSQMMYRKLDAEGKYNFDVYGNDGQVIIHRTNIDLKTIEDFVGKEITQKIKEGKGEKDEVGWQTLSGLDLKIGGKWAFNLYDKMIPQYLKKFGKKYKAQVGTTEINGNEQQTFTITPQLKQAALSEGMPLFESKVTDGSGTSFSVSQEKENILFETKELDPFATSPDKVAETVSEIINNLRKSKLGRRFSSEVVSTKDMNLWQKALETPYVLAKKFPAMEKALRTEIRRHESRSQKMFDYYHGDLDKLQTDMKKHPKDLKALEDLTWEWEDKRMPKEEVPTDWHSVQEKIEKGETYGDLIINPEHYAEVKKFLLKQGHKEIVVDGFITRRKVLDEILIEADEKMRSSNVDLTDLQEFRAHIGKTNNYFPHVREGDSYIRVYDKNTKKVIYREHFKKLKERFLKPENKARQRTQRWVKEQIKSGKLEGKESDYRVGQARTVEQLPDEVYFQIPVEALDQLSKQGGRVLAAEKVSREAKRLMKIEGLSEKDAHEKAYKLLTADMEKALAKAFSDVLKTRGWGSHAIKRMGVEGYKKDETFRIMFQYLSGYAGFSTKIDAVKEHHKTLHDIDAKKQPKLYKYTSDYIRDMTANADKVDNAVDKVRAALFFKFLGGVIKSGLVNLTQNVVMAAPVLSQYTKKSHRKLARAMYDTRKAVTGKNAWLGKETDYKGISANEIRALHEMVESGAAQDLFLRELKGRVPTSGMGAMVNKVLNKAGIFMQIAEKFNRASTGLAAYRIAMNEGATYDGRKTKNNHDLSVRFAKKAIYDSHFLYGKSNLPAAFRGGDFRKVARAAYTFRSFTHNYLDIMSDMLLNQGTAGKKVVARSLMNIFAVGGLVSVPFFKAFSEMLKYVTDDDDEDLLTQLRAKMPNKFMKDLLVYGIPGATMGVDVSGSLSIEVPRNFKDIIGVPYSFGQDTVNMVKSVKAGNMYRAAAETPFTPILIRNAMRGIDLYARGQTTRAGKEINAPGKKGARKITGFEAVLKSVAGLQPVSVSSGYKAYRASTKMKQGIAERKRALVDRFINAMRRNDGEELQKIRREINTWNKKAYQERKPWRVIAVDKMIEYRLKDKGLRTFPKRMRGQAKDIYETWQQ